MQRVKVKTELVHFLDARCGVEFGQPPQNSTLHFDVDFRSFALQPELAKGLISECFDHDLSRFASMLFDVSYLLTNVKRTAASRQASSQLIRRPLDAGRNESSKISAARRFGAEFDILCQLIDRSRKAGRIDAADAAAFHLFGQDIVADDGAQARQFEIARSAFHLGQHVIHRPRGSLMASRVPAITARRNAFTASGLPAAKAGLTINAKP